MLPWPWLDLLFHDAAMMQRQVPQCGGPGALLDLLTCNRPIGLLFLAVALTPVVGFFRKKHSTDYRFVFVFGLSSLFLWAVSVRSGIALKIGLGLQTHYEERDRHKVIREDMKRTQKN